MSTTLEFSAVRGAQGLACFISLCCFIYYLSKRPNVGWESMRPYSQPSATQSPDFLSCRLVGAIDGGNILLHSHRVQHGAAQACERERDCMDSLCQLDDDLPRFALPDQVDLYVHMTMPVMSTCLYCTISRRPVMHVSMHKSTHMSTRMLTHSGLPEHGNFEGQTVKKTVTVPCACTCA